MKGSLADVLLERPIGPEGFVGEELDGIKAAGEELLGFVLVEVLGKEPVALAGAPEFGELVLAKENIGGVGIAGTPEQCGAFPVLAAAREHQQGRFSMEKAVRIKNDGRSVRLIPEDDDGVGRRTFLDDGVGQLLGAEHGIESGESNVRGDEKHC